MRDWLPASELREVGPVVLGYRLRPLTLGHLELLDELGIETFGDWSLTEMLVLVVVLTQDHRQSRRDIRKWWFPPMFALIGFLNRKADLRKEAAKLDEYLRTQTVGPTTLQPITKKRGSCAAPIHVNLMASCLSRLHLSLDETRDLTVRKAKHLIYAAAEAAGEVEIASSNMLSFAERVRQYEAAQRGN